MYKLLNKLSCKIGNGRELTSITKGETTVEFEYDINGMRTEKTVGGIPVQYYYDDNNKLVGLIFDGMTFLFYYDENGEIAFAENKNGVVYLFKKNAQGDIVAILNSTGQVIVNYTYDAWGNTLSVTDASGNDASSNLFTYAMPFRYRGYIYDVETGLYYLQSRYYDPQTGRFINADAYTDTETGTPLSTNMFAYCENNPVMYSDPTGYWAVSDHRTICRENGFSGGFYKTVRDWSENADKYPCEVTSYYSTPFHGLTLYGMDGLERAKELYKIALDLKTKSHKVFFSFDERVIGQTYDINFLKYKYKSGKYVYLDNTRKAQNELINVLNNAESANEQSKILLGLTLHLVQDYFAHMMQVKSIYRVYKSPLSNTVTYVPIFSSRKNKGTVSMYKVEDLIYEKDNNIVEDNKRVFKWRYTLARVYTKKISTKWINNQEILIFKEKTDKNGNKIRTLRTSEASWYHKKWKIKAYEPTIEFK